MIETARLILRAWREEDVAPFHAMGQDAEVMRYLGAPTTWAGARDMVNEQIATAARFGRCLWVVERRSDAAFLGFCGVEPGPKGSPIDGVPEIGWRLVREAWGVGYATEAARAALRAEWSRGSERVFAITVPANRRSWGLMERLGMTRVVGGDFDHPDLPPDHPLRPHILYRIDRPAHG